MSEETTAAADAFDQDHYRDPDTAGRYFEAGWEAEQQRDRSAAVEAYEAAYTADPDDSRICFRLAYNLDLLGEEDEALHLYEQGVDQEHPPLHGLINLAVLYEDRGDYSRAERCLRQVLTTDPDHDRARLFLRDVMAGQEMQIEDEPTHDLAVDTALLETPVTDFDLTVRTRNALRKENIRTLGDLLRVTEADLRSFKNFGDTSLDEIKAMLAQRGLRLGQAVDQQQQQTKQQVYDQLRTETEGGEELLARSINDLNLSVRVRKALALLNIQTISDLVSRTEAELMGIKNFGTTSLSEVREKLDEHGLELRRLETE